MSSKAKSMSWDSPFNRRLRKDVDFPVSYHSDSLSDPNGLIWSLLLRISRNSVFFLNTAFRRRLCQTKFQSKARSALTHILVYSIHCRDQLAVCSLKLHYLGIRSKDTVRHKNRKIHLRTGSRIRNRSQWKAISDLCIGTWFPYFRVLVVPEAAQAVLRHFRSKFSFFFLVFF